MSSAAIALPEAASIVGGTVCGDTTYVAESVAIWFSGSEINDKMARMIFKYWCMLPGSYKGGSGSVRGREEGEGGGGGRRRGAIRSTSTRL